MHFRSQKQIIQVIRTVHDPERQKNRNKVIGKINMSDLVISDELRSELTSSELQETEAWISGCKKTFDLENEYIARTLANNIKRAAQWFETSSVEDASQIYIEIQESLRNLKKAAKGVHLI